MLRLIDNPSKAIAVVNTIPTVNRIHELYTQLQSHGDDQQQQQQHHRQQQQQHDDGSFNDDSHNSSNNSSCNDSQHDTTNINTNINTNSSTGTTTADANKLNLRLKEMFKERITKFREAVYILTGFKVLFITIINIILPP